MDIRYTKYDALQLQRACVLGKSLPNAPLHGERRAKQQETCLFHVASVAASLLLLVPKKWAEAESNHDFFFSFFFFLSGINAAAALIHPSRSFCIGGDDPFSFFLLFNSHCRQSHMRDIFYNDHNRDVFQI